MITPCNVYRCLRDVVESGSRSRNDKPRPNWNTERDALSYIAFTTTHLRLGSKLSGTSETRVRGPCHNGPLLRTDRTTTLVHLLLVLWTVCRTTGDLYTHSGNIWWVGTYWRSTEVGGFTLVHSGCLLGKLTWIYRLVV